MDGTQYIITDCRDDNGYPVSAVIYTKKSNGGDHYEPLAYSPNKSVFIWSDFGSQVGEEQYFNFNKEDFLSGLCEYGFGEWVGMTKEEQRSYRIRYRIRFALKWMRRDAYLSRVEPEKKDQFDEHSLALMKYILQEVDKFAKKGT